jgi:hypothetical protein
MATTEAKGAQFASVAVTVCKCRAKDNTSSKSPITPWKNMQKSGPWSSPLSTNQARRGKSAQRMGE